MVKAKEVVLVLVMVWQTMEIVVEAEQAEAVVEVEQMVDLEEALAQVKVLVQESSMEQQRTGQEGVVELVAVAEQTGGLAMVMDKVKVST